MLSSFWLHSSYASGLINLRPVTLSLEGAIKSTKSVLKKYGIKFYLVPFSSKAQNPPFLVSGFSFSCILLFIYVLFSLSFCFDNRISDDSYISVQDMKEVSLALSRVPLYIFQ